MGVKPLTCVRKGRLECEMEGQPAAGVGQAGHEVSVPAATADAGERKTGKAMHGNDFAKMLEVVFPDTAIGNDVAGALRAFQREHAGTGIRIVYKIAK